MSVLDLATGGGIVLDLLGHSRADLKLTGVDAAPGLPKRAGLTLIGEMTTDRLRFPAGKFDGVTSRFGIEYGPLSEGGAEAARVLKPGGRLCFVLHHAGSRVLQHNRARRAALHWAAIQSGWVDKALNVARMRESLPVPVPPGFRAAAEEAKARFPGQSVAWEFLTGMAQVLEAGPRGGGEPMIRELVSRADDELARIDTLTAAACDDDRLAVLTQALERTGVAVEPGEVIAEPDGTPLAWLVTGHKTP